MLSGVHIDVDEAQIADFCRKHHIRNLWLFGSVLREDFGPNSDVDILVEFEEGKTPGLVFFDVEEELAEIIRRPIHLLTEPSLRNPFLRHEILETRRLVYAA